MHTAMTERSESSDDELIPHTFRFIVGDRICVPATNARTHTHAQRDTRRERERDEELLLQREGGSGMIHNLIVNLALSAPHQQVSWGCTYQ